MTNTPNATATATTRGGVSGAILLTIAFFVAKVTGYIDWDWIWVFSPLWISFALGIIGMLIFLSIVLFVAWTDSRPTYPRKRK